MKTLIIEILLTLAAVCSGLSDCDQKGTELTMTEESADKLMLADNISLGKSETDSTRNPVIAFSLKSDSYFFKPQFKATADSALKIAAAVYNSEEFKDSLSKYMFRCRSFGYRCAQQCADCKNGRFSIRTVFDSLYRQANVELTLHLEPVMNL